MSMSPARHAVSPAGGPRRAHRFHGMLGVFNQTKRTSFRRGVFAMTIKTGFGNRLAVLTAVATMTLVATAVWAQKAQQKAGEDIQGFRAGMVGIRAQIDTTLEALNGVVQSANGGDPKSAFKKYSDQIKNMDKQIEKTRSYRQKMQEQGQAYFKEWEAKMGAVTNEE